MSANATQILSSAGTVAVITPKEFVSTNLEIAITAPDLHSESVHAETTEAPSILSKAFDILRAFNSVERVMTLSELARAANLPKSTVHRLLARLIEQGAVEHHRAGYRLGLGLLQLAANTPVAHIRGIAMPYLASLHRWTGETVSFGVLRGSEVVLLERISRHGTSDPLSAIGSRLPAHCTALGKSLLAHEDLDQLRANLPATLPVLTTSSVSDPDELIAELRTVRADGLARQRDETQLGVSCVAAPIVINYFAVAALSVVAPAGTAGDPRVDSALRDIAQKIAQDARRDLANGYAGWFPREI
jgi:DNA-binding IclR family transcriptional regulator